MLILEQESAGENGASLEYFVYFSQVLVQIISGKEHLVKFLLDFPLGRNFLQLSQGNFSFRKETFRS